MTGVIPYYYHLYSLVADRYLYLPLLGASLAVAGPLRYLLTTKLNTTLRLTGCGSCIVMLSLLGFMSAVLTLIWKDSVTLASDITRHPSHDPDSYLILGWNAAHQNRYEDALRYDQTALQIDPHNPKTHNSIATIYLALGQPAQAIEYFRRAVRLAPRIAATHGNLGVALFGQGHYREAISHLRKALELHPDNEKWRNYLGRAEQRASNRK
jgi:tetratricopeptide (TPR) repeat protein